MTYQEKEILKRDILDQLLLEALPIEALTPVASLAETDLIELDGGRHVSFEVLSSAIGGSVSTGLDITQLSQYLANNHYATKSWVETFVNQQGFLTPSDISGKADKATTLAGYGITDAYISGATITLGSQSITPLLANSLKSLTFQAGAFSPASYLPTSASSVSIPTKTSHLTNDSDYITSSALIGLASTEWVQQNYVSKTDFEQLFEKVNIGTSASPVWAIKAKLGLYSEDFISARGLNPYQNQGSVGVTTLAGLDDVMLGNNLANGQALIYSNGVWVNGNAGIDPSVLADYAKKSEIPSLAGYATTEWVQQNYVSQLALTSALNSLSNTLTLEIDKKLDQSEFDDFVAKFDSMFVLEDDANSPLGKRIKALFGLYSEHFISARGANPWQTSGSVGLDEEQLAEYLDEHGYLTSADLDLSKYALQTALSAHAGNASVHVTADEKQLWNTAASNLGTILGSDSNDVIDKWEEILAFLDTYTEADTLANLLSNKVSRSGDTMTGSLAINGGALVINGSSINPHDGGGFVFSAGDSMKLALGTASLYPMTSAYTLGNSASRWTLMYAANLNVSNSITLGDCVISWDADKGGVKFSTGIYSEQWISARGANADASSGGGGGLIQRVYGYADLGGTFSDTDKDDTFNAYTINYINSKVNNVQASLSGYQPAGSYVTTSALTTALSGYATQQWVGQQGFLTALPDHTHSQYLTTDTAASLYQPKGNYLTSLPSHSHDYLPLSGGSLTNGTNADILTLNFTGNVEVGLRFQLQNNSKGWVGYHPTYGTNLYNYATGIYLGLRDNGNGYIGNNLILTSANIGSYALTSLPSHSHEYISNSGDKTAISGTTLGDSGLRLYQVYNNGYPCTFGNVLNIGGVGFGELLCEWSGTTSKTGNLYYRSKRDVSSTAWGDWVTIVDSSNISSYAVTASALGNYLPLSGGTLKRGAATDVLTLDTDSTSEVGIRLSLGGTQKGWVGYNTTFETYLWNQGGGYLGMRSNGNAYVNGSKIWHSGNDGSGSGLDADLLDGVHNGEVTARYIAPYAIPIGGKYVQWFTGQPALGTADGNAVKGSSNNIKLWSYPDGGTTDSATTANIMNLRLGWGDAYWSDIFMSPNNQRVFYRVVSHNSAKAWREFAMKDDNVASATRLQGSYSLWGQTFYGNNVSGNMTGVGSIGFSNGTEIGFNNGRFCFGTTNQAEANSVNVGSLLVSNAWADYTKVPANGAYIKGNVSMGNILTINGVASTDNGISIVGSKHTLRLIIGSGNDNRGIYDNTNGLWWIYRGGDTNTYIQGGNVGINKTSPEYALDVTGDIRASEYVRCKLVNINGGGIEIFHATPYIDFYYNNTTADYDVRLINDISGRLKCTGVFYSVTGIWSDGYVSARGQNTSDARLKCNIRDFDASAIIRSISPKAFQWNAMARAKFHALDTDATQYGLIAQEVMPVAPWLVDANMFGDGLMGVHYHKLIPILLKGQQETMSEVDALKADVRQLKEENRELKRKIEILERR